MTWLHKFRKIMVLPQRDKLRGNVEVDETFIGGVKKENVDVERMAKPLLL